MNQHASAFPKACRSQAEIPPSAGLQAALQLSSKWLQSAGLSIGSIKPVVGPVPMGSLADPSLVISCTITIFPINNVIMRRGL